MSLPKPPTPPPSRKISPDVTVMDFKFFGLLYAFIITVSILLFPIFSQDKFIMDVVSKKPIQLKARYLELTAYSVDRNTVKLLTADDQTIAEQKEGYVPSFMPNNDGGDQLKITIDLKDMRVVGLPLTPADLQEWINEVESDGE